MKSWSRDSDEGKILYAGRCEQTAPWELHYEVLEFKYKTGRKYFQLAIRSGNTETVIDLPVAVARELSEAFTYVGEVAGDQKEYTNLYRSYSKGKFIGEDDNDDCSSDDCDDDGEA